MKNKVIYVDFSTKNKRKIKKNNFFNMLIYRIRRIFYNIFNKENNYKKDNHKMHSVK
ncbi:hypothetical protein [Clostridium sp. JN-9]|uniref:hypothetical protein n=1 Tax=Clostridium sp. JN-9 TaxID=2507159 RepID=UPI0013E8AC78|nr:hypothetical protein [Clostridium sp. JN-9]